MNAKPTGLHYAGAAAAFLLCLLAVVSPSWAWGRGSWGFRGGHVRIGLGWPWFGYYPYYPPYDPYYYPYAYPDYGPVPPLDYYDPPYTYPKAHTTKTRQPQTSQDNWHRDLKIVGTHLSRMRDLLNYKYEDGDMSKVERDAGLRYLVQIDAVARSEATDNGGTLTANQEDALLDQIRRADPANHRPVDAYPEVTPTPASQAATSLNVPSTPGKGLHSLLEVNDLLLELRTLVDEKVKDGAITRPQHDAEITYLKEIEQRARTAADANGGMLTGEQEHELIQQLHKAYYTIHHNFIVN